MRVMSYVELTEAQAKTLECLQDIVVRASLIKPSVVATVRTFQAQELKLTIDESGVILKAQVED